MAFSGMSKKSKARESRVKKGDSIFCLHLRIAILNHFLVVAKYIKTMELWHV
jgi:hypothetical protein